MSQAYSIRRGDTLGALARRFGTSVDALAKANHIKAPDRISAGAKLRVPDAFEAKPAVSRPPAKPAGDTFETKSGAKPESRPAAKPGSATWRDEQTGREFPSRDGVPNYNQADPAWAKQDLGTGSRNHNIQSAGCAISACAMAVSKLSGKTFTPEEMDRYLDKHQGYQGDMVCWEKTAAAAKSNPPITATRRHGMSPSAIDRELAAGRPVVIGVDYKNGKGTDHWMTVTGKNKDGTYNVNDPAGGRAIRMQVRNGVLQSADAASTGSRGRSYKFDGNAVTFAGGNPQRSPVSTRPAEAPRAQPPVSPTRTETPARPGGAVGSNGYKSISPADFRKGGTQSLAAIVIGTAEGNRTPKGGIVAENFGGHSDPANKKRNIGSFSVQGKKAEAAGGDPRRADEIQLRELASVTPSYEKAARAAGLDPNNALLLAAYYDMQTQSPATAQAFLKELPRLGRQGATVESITDARVRAFMNNGKTGGWHDTPWKVRPDAARRMGELVRALKAQGLAG